MSRNERNSILEQISAFASEIPLDLVRSVADAIGKVTVDNWRYSRNQIIASIHQPNLKVKVAHLLDTWQKESQELPPTSVALALLAAAKTAERYRGAESVSLIWTGPTSQQVSLRRTDQALLQVVNTAQQRLLIVSFAVYKIEPIRNAIVQAAERGVEIKICIEAPEPSEGKITYYTIQALGHRVVQNAKVYIWPLSKRPRDTQGHHGSLHVKCAVADERLLFLSSANLTEYAFTLNMELGVLISGGKLPGYVAKHFEWLIEDSVLVPLS